MSKPTPLKQANPKRTRTRKTVPMHEGDAAKARMIAGMKFAIAGGPTPKKQK